MHRLTVFIEHDRALREYVDLFAGQTQEANWNYDGSNQYIHSLMCQNLSGHSYVKWSDLWSLRPRLAIRPCHYEFAGTYELGYGPVIDLVSREPSTFPQEVLCSSLCCFN